MALQRVQSREEDCSELCGSFIPKGLLLPHSLPALLQMSLASFWFSEQMVPQSSGFAIPIKQLSSTGSRFQISSRKGKLFGSA